MAVAMLSEWAPSGDRNTINYDAINEYINFPAEVPEGLLAHSAGFTDDGAFRIFDIWESAEAARRFGDEKLMPAIQAGAAGEGASPPDRQELYELHDFYVGGLTR
jgi:hypothetical protein